MNSSSALVQGFGYSNELVSTRLDRIETKDSIRKLLESAAEKAIKSGMLEYHEDLEDSLEFFQIEGDSDLAAFRGYLLKLINRLK